jgi:hypothetical protein
MSTKPEPKGIQLELRTCGCCGKIFACNSRSVRGMCFRCYRAGDPEMAMTTEEAIKRANQARKP